MAPETSGASTSPYHSVTPKPPAVGCADTPEVSPAATTGSGSKRPFCKRRSAPAAKASGPAGKSTRSPVTLKLMLLSVWSLESCCTKPIQFSISGVIVPEPPACPPSRLSGTQPGIARHASGSPRACSILRALWAPSFV